MIKPLSRPGLLLGSLTLLFVPADAFAAASVSGRWLTEDGKAIVTIEPCGAMVCGRIVQILAPTPNGPPVDSGCVKSLPRDFTGIDFGARDSQGGRTMIRCPGRLGG